MSATITAVAEELRAIESKCTTGSLKLNSFGNNCEVRT